MTTCTLWGYRTQEYLKMFDLTIDPKTRFLEYACGPSAFNHDLLLKGCRAISCDGLFELEKEALSRYVASAFREGSEQLKVEPSLNLKDYGNHLETLIAMRKKGLQLFLADYEKGKEEGRYCHLEPGKLPFEDFSFDIAVSAYHLFISAELGDADFYLTTLKELARVAKEVRLFPLVGSQGEPSPMLGPILLGLQLENYGVEVKEVSYHLQPNANAMLRIWAQQCPLSS